MGSDVLLGHDGLIPVYLRDDHRTAHVAILGKSRFGKTTLLEHLVLNDMRSGTATIVIDAHGDLTKRLVALAPSQERDRIVLVEPNPERPFGLNLYECADATDARQVTATVGSVVEIFRKLMGAEGTGYLPLIESGLRNTARAIIANHFTMAEIHLLYRDQGFRGRALAALADPGDYWREYEASSPQRQQDKREPVLNKVARFLEDDLVAPMVKQSHTTVPFRSVMDSGGTLLLNLAGLDRDTVSFLGMVFLSVFSNLIHQREQIPSPQRRRVHLYLDEYGRFATPTTKRLLEEGGKYGLGMTIAHQSLAQTPEREALNVQTLISFQLGAEDAHAVAGGFDCTPTRRKKVARQRTEPQYRKWEEVVWDSEKSRSLYEALCRDLEEAESDYDSVQARGSEAWEVLTALYPSKDAPPARDALKSSDGTLDGVRMLQRLDRVGSSISPPRLRYELREILTRLYREYGREPRGEELLEAKEWINQTGAVCEQAYEDMEAALPEKRKRCADLRSMAERYHRQHTSLEWRKEYVGETPVRDSQGRLMYDHIEEIDQTHADRQAEIANMLTQLPRYAVYCKVFDKGGRSHEYRIQTLPPATPDEREIFDSQLERAVRIAKKKRGAGEIHLEKFGSMSPETGFTFKPKEFQETISGLMQDIRYDVRTYGQDPTSEHRVEEVRARSRKQFGTPRSEIEEQVRKRRRSGDDEGGSGHLAKRPDDGGQPPSPPLIGRRSPKR
ncbi:type IV secretory system conjugative DNA transfer family protein [Streptomyces scabiei]|uniref:type IV secretory system conjugative DNA transfer family protein n=1 Tax=Streptomyces scabiei TaxID=1930 RepID=UPI000A8CDEF8|nr:DUF87 domain-containing protein [Streptomyces scabiei]